jgi:Flp pilus assembly protein TadB
MTPPLAIAVPPVMAAGVIPPQPASMGHAAALVLLAAALLALGGRPARARLRALHRPPPSTAAPEPPPLRASWVAIGALAVGALGWAALGPLAGLLLAAAAGAAGAVALRRTATPAGPALEQDTELAAGWELLAVCLEAGLPVAVAVTAAAESLTGSVGARLRRVSGLLELGADPADAWPAAGDVPALATFARAAGRSASTGSALAQVARAEGTRIRAALLDSAHARAQRAGVLITGPLGLCFLPAFLVLGIAPVVIGLADDALSWW